MTTLYARVTSKSAVPGPDPGEVLGYQIVLAADADGDTSWAPADTTPSLSASFIVTPEAAEAWQLGSQVALSMEDVTPAMLREGADAGTETQAADAPAVTQETGTLQPAGDGVDGTGSAPAASSPAAGADTPQQATATTRKA